MTFSLRSFFAFFSALWQAIVRDHPYAHHDVRTVIFRQIFFTGLLAFRMIALSAVVLGVLAVSQSGTQLSRFGGADSIGGILVGAFIRELGPLVVLIVVVARSVSAIASELASMKANGEIDALRAMGISPFSYLVFSRVFSGIVSTMLLGMHFVWIALTVGYFTAQVFIDMSVDRYINSLLNALGGLDIFIFLLKTGLVGAVVFLLACFCGLRTTGATFEIPQATTKAVVWSYMFCFGAQILISAVYYFFMFQHLNIGGLI